MKFSAMGLRLIVGVISLLSVQLVSAQTGTGLTGKYYDDTTFAATVTTRTDAGISSNFGTVIPAGTAITAATTYSASVS